MSKKNLFAVFTFFILAGSAWALKPGAIFVDSSKLEWKEVMPGVSAAAVQGKSDQGASHFFLKYAGGLKTPSHHHTPDHYVTLVSGNLTMVVDGAEHKLSPGSFFALTNKMPHIAMCAEGADCVMSVDSRGKWDVVPEKK